MGILGIAVAVVVVAIAGVGGTAGYLYATDYELKADVTGTDCLVNTVSVHTRTFGIDHDVQGVPQDQCNILEPGDYVEYRIRTKQTTLYREGQCIYDSVTGPWCGNPPPIGSPLLL